MILVTGGEGFIGINLVNELKNRGYKVLSLDLQHNDQKDYIRADIRNYRQLERVFDKFEIDCVYHLAAEYGRWNGEDYYENLWETNVIGTKHLIRLQEKLGFRMIFFSSSEVYGDYKGIMTEDVMEYCTFNEVHQLNDYAMTKWVGELICMNSAQMFDTETVRVRPANTYGPHNHYTPYTGFLTKFIHHALFNIPYTVYIGHKRIVDYVDDSVRTFANILDNFIPGEVYNVGGRLDWEKDIKEYSDIVLDAVGNTELPIRYAETELFTTEAKKVDSSKAVKDLKHNPKIPPEEGIKRTVEWMRRYYENNPRTAWK